MNKWLRWVLGVGGMCLLSGCLMHVAIPVQIPIQGNSNYRVIDAKVAVDGSGALHIVHSECDKTFSVPCFISYHKVRVGMVIDSRSWWPPLNGSQTLAYINPDIVVTDDGVAYIAWQYKDSSNDYFDMWTTSNSAEAPLYVESPYKSNGPPRLATNGTVVFVLYKVVDGTGNAYRYKRISQVDPWVGGWASPHGDNIRRSAEDAAVSPDNKLYVTWAVYNSGVNSIYYNDNHNSAGDMTNLHTIVSNQSVLDPKIDVTKEGTTTYVYLLYHDFEPDAHPTSSDLALVICPNLDCSSYSTHLLNLPAAQHWGVGGYALRGVGNRAYVVFTALKDGLSRTQVFQTGYKVSPPEDYPVQQITNGAHNHSNAQILAFAYAFGDYQVLTYQRDMASCDYNLYEYDTLNNQETLLGEHVFGDQDMAMNMSSGEVYIGATWVTPNRLEGDGRWAAFYSYNDAPLFLPLVAR